MTEKTLEQWTKRPNPLITLVPLWILANIVLLVVGAVALFVTASLAPKYNMTRIGQPILLVTPAASRTPAEGRAPPPAATSRSWWEALT